MAEIFTFPREVGDGAIKDPVEAAVVTAVFNSMQVVRKAQQQRVLLCGASYDSEIKSDGSLLTPVDIRSQRMASAIIQHMLPGVPFRGEEKLADDVIIECPRSTARYGVEEIGYDPTDGTRPLAVGAPTSTVIGVAYKRDGSVYGAAIGEPATERLYSAFGDESTQGRLFDLRSGETLASAHARTWGGSLFEKGQVFIDNTIPHPHNGHDTLTAEQHINLRQILQQNRIGVMEMGSNGAHQLYVASGGDRAAMAITTARGIPEDTSAGAFLVERAGGAVQRYNAINGVISHALRETPEYDLLVAANNDTTLRYADELLLSLSQ